MKNKQYSKHFLLKIEPYEEKIKNNSQFQDV